MVELFVAPGISEVEEELVGACSCSRILRWGLSRWERLIGERLPACCADVSGCLGAGGMADFAEAIRVSHSARSRLSLFHSVSAGLLERWG